MIIHHREIRPKERQPRQPRLHHVHPRQGGQHVTARFRLPPGIHDRAASSPDDAVIPEPSLWINRLSHRAQQPQRGQVVLFDPVIPPADKGTDGGGSGVKNGHPVLGNDSPKTVRLGLVGRSLIHQGGRPVAQRPVHRITVSRHPTHIGRTPKKILLLQVKNPFRREMGTQKIPRRRVQDALGLPGAAAGVEDEKRVLTLQLLRREIRRLMVGDFMPPAVDLIELLHRPGSLEHNHSPDLGTTGHGRIHIFL